MKKKTIWHNLLLALVKECRHPKSVTRLIGRIHFYSFIIHGNCPLHLFKDITIGNHSFISLEYVSLSAALMALKTFFQSFLWMETNILVVIVSTMMARDFGSSRRSKEWNFCTADKTRTRWDATTQAKHAFWIINIIWASIFGWINRIGCNGIGLIYL